MSSSLSGKPLGSGSNDAGKTGERVEHSGVLNATYEGDGVVYVEQKRKRMGFEGSDSGPGSEGNWISPMNLSISFGSVAFFFLPSSSIKVSSAIGSPGLVSRRETSQIGFSLGTGSQFRNQSPGFWSPRDWFGTSPWDWFGTGLSSNQWLTCFKPRNVTFSMTHFLDNANSAFVTFDSTTTVLPTLLLLNFTSVHLPPAFPISTSSPSSRNSSPVLFSLLLRTIRSLNAVSRATSVVIASPCIANMLPWRTCEIMTPLPRRNCELISYVLSSSVVFPENPHISAPTIGIANNPEFKILGMEYAKSFQVAALSPVQCAVYFPEPGNVDLASINGLLLVIFTNAAFVALDSKNPYRGGTADELSVLIHHRRRRRSGEEIQIDNPTDDFVSDPIAVVDNIHAVTAQEEHSMRGSRGRSDVHVESVGAVQIEVEIGASNVGVPQSQRLVVTELERSLGVLSDAVEVRSVGRQRGGELEVLVFEDEQSVRTVGHRRGVEEDVAGGTTVDREAEWAGGCVL
nr:predicted protein [Ipomoea batatas]